MTRAVLPTPGMPSMVWMQTTRPGPAVSRIRCNSLSRPTKVSMSRRREVVTIGRGKGSAVAAFHKRCQADRFDKVDGIGPDSAVARRISVVSTGSNVSNCEVRCGRSANRYRGYNQVVLICYEVLDQFSGDVECELDSWQVTSSGATDSNV
ncbi:hypothetical protein [Nocardia sp. NPDC051570]|uniref:hypothetical protein n=1 Tax=Nocardia sp. NPDC051570 TaxID=3364324 RepID=UPI00379135D1